MDQQMGKYLTDRGSIVVSKTAKAPAPYYGKILEDKGENWHQVKTPANGDDFGIWENQERLALAIVVKGLLIWVVCPTEEVFQAEVDGLRAELRNVEQDPDSGKFFEKPEQGNSLLQ